MSPSDLFAPQLSAGSQALLRSAYGLLLLLTLAHTLPHWRRFFLSERWGGYAKALRSVDLIQNPYVVPLLLAAWVVAGALLVLGEHSVPAAGVNLALCRYFFVHMRWKSVLRGMGAPGFMTYWLAAAVFFLEYGQGFDPTGEVRAAALVALQVDFAAIMICAGTYKVLSGYPRNAGMELGMVNPWWGYWWWLYSRLRPSHWLFRALNHLAYLSEILAGILMLLPSGRMAGASLIFIGFLFIATQIRLAFLCEMVMLCCLLYVPAGGALDRAIAGLAAPTEAHSAAPAWLNNGFTWFFWGYVALLPFAKLGQYYNFLARRGLPRRIQTALESYTNFFGIIIWRVFSVDVTNFFVNVHIERSDGSRDLYSRPGRFDWRMGFRYLHVGEFVCMASLFTTMKYYPSQWPLFVERLVRYARTIPCPASDHLVFEYVSIRKEQERFLYDTVAEYVVDPRRGEVQERSTDASASVRAAAAVSPVHEGAKPGSYAPASEPGAVKES